MNVVHVTRDFPPRHCGGISTAVYGLARAQVRSGLDVAAVSFDAWRPRTERPAGTPPRVEHVDGIAVLRLSSAAQLDTGRAFARAQRPALLHVHHGMLWDFAAGLRAELGVPAVKTVHVVQHRMNALHSSGERTLSLAGQEAALAAADRNIAPSRAAADALLAAQPGLAPRLRVVGHGVDDSPAARAAVARHVAAPGRGALLAVGRLAETKGTPELFAVMRSVLDALPSAAIVVAGGVPANRRAEARWVRRWHTKTPGALRERAAFTGWIDAVALAQRYHDAAGLLAPSRYETFGLVVLEAMLHGLPIAASAAGGVTELVDDRETGLLSPPGDAATLTAHAVALLADPTLAQRLGRNAAAAARRGHLWEHVLPALLAVYAELA